MGKKVIAIILAAGKGTRMKSCLPKVLHKIAGKPMLHYVFDTLSALEVEETIAVIGPDMEVVEQEISGVASGTQVIIQEEQLGTGHAVQQALPYIKNQENTVLVLYADTPFISAATLEKMLAEEAAVTVLGFQPQDPAEYGRLVVNNGELERIVEFKDGNKEEQAIGLCNSGVMAIVGSQLAELLDELDNNNAKGEYYLTDIVAIAREKGYRCTVVEAKEEEVMGVNSRDQQAQAEAAQQEQLRAKAMEGGATLVAPETVFLCEDTELGQDVVIQPNVVFGPGVKVENNVEIRSFSHIEGAHIKSGAVIGPFARIRPGSEIGEEARVGNFVEVKNSKLDKGVKASHLSYIGDSEIGEEANIGAGTITCNYDGFEKHKTEIGKNTFIGSNSSLIAPVKVGEGAIVGAGSTITKDVPAEAVVINEMPQKTVENRAKEIRKEKAG